MSMPTDASIRIAYQEMKNVPLGEWWYAKVLERAAEIDAEAAAPAPFERCPKCTAHLPPGKHCAGASCPMRCA